MCSDNVFAIIVWDFIKIAWKLQNLQLITSVYPKEKSVKFQKLRLLKQWFVNPPSTQTLDCSDKKSKLMQVLWLFRSSVITKDFYQ